MGLTASQTEKLSQIVTLIRAGEKRIVLKGMAGTGKTYMTNEIIRVLKTILYSYGAVYVTAPTHKALNVLRTKIDNKPYIIFKTIHSALSLKMKRDYNTGETYFTQEINPKYPPFQAAQIVLLDEASMVGKDVKAYISKYPNLIFIFIGDPGQLNPPGEEHSPIFLGEEIEFDENGKCIKWKEYPTVELTEIVRQGAGNPIITLSRDLSLIWTKRGNMTEEGCGYFFDNNGQMIVEKLAEVNGSDDLKYLAYMNTDVDKVNLAVRQRIYGTPHKVEKGESLIFGAPYSNINMYTTNQEIKVQNLDVREFVCAIPTEKTTLNFVDGVAKLDTKSERMETKLKIYTVNDDINILHEQSEQDFKSMGKKLKEDAKKGKIKWPVYYWFIEQFADVTYNHAITVHKSQGSTYRRAVINVKNINFNRNAIEKERMFYTAVTRASEKVCLFNVR